MARELALKTASIFAPRTSAPTASLGLLVGHTARRPSRSSHVILVPGLARCCHRIVGGAHLHAHLFEL